MNDDKKPPKTNMRNTFLNFMGEGEAFIICGPTEPDGVLGLSYQGDVQQLKFMLRTIRETLRDKEKIGNHPNRPRPTRGNR